MEPDVESPNENEFRRKHDVERVYRNEHIAVTWEPKLCIHAGYCFRSRPEVFQPECQLWVKVNKATAEQIAETMMLCPTGALHFKRLDGGPREPQPGETTIQARPSGPLYVRGGLASVQLAHLGAPIRNSFSAWLSCQAYLNCNEFV